MSQLCKLYGVTTGGFYAWSKRPVSQHRQHDLRLIEAIREFHHGFRRAYGAPRMHHVLREQLLSCSVRRVNRLMKEAGIKASTTGLYIWRPGIQEFYSCAGNHLAESETATGSGEQWAGDFTHIHTGAGWLYLAVVIDLYCRKVVGWSFSRSRNTHLTKRALQMAIANQAIKPGCLFHSDQGVEYTAYEYRDELEAAGLTRSMSRKGTPLDNAAVESFFHTLKAELVHQHTFCDQIEATAHIVAYIEFYNRERIHTSLNFQSPMEYEKLCA